MIKAILIDDEAYIRSIIKEKLAQRFSNEIEVVGETGTVKDAVQLIQEKSPDLLFLDIHLTDGTSFDILSKIAHKHLKLIFITGFDDQAIKAIKVGALDYIVKPIEDFEFDEAIEKVLKSAHNNTEKLVEVSKEHFRKSTDKKRIVLKTLESMYIVYEEDIFYCKSEGNYTTFYTAKFDKIVISKPMKMVEELLSKDIFIRSHKSYLINKNHVRQYNKQGLLVISSEHKVPVSSRRKDKIVKQIFS